jgi:hypothetical protein
VDDWDDLSNAAQRKARSRDALHLTAVLNEKAYRAEEVFVALRDSGLLASLWDSAGVWHMRVGWLRKVLELFYDDSWNERLAMHLKCDLLLSTRQMQRLRMLMSFDYDATTDMRNQRMLRLREPTVCDEDDCVAYPHPVVSRYKWEPAWVAMKARFNLKVDPEGRVVRQSLRAAILNVLDRDAASGRMYPLESFTNEWPWRPCLQFDGTGLWSYSLCHGALKNTGYVASVSQHSERLLETLFVAHSHDDHLAMLDILGEYDPPTPGSLASEAADLIAAGVFEYKGVSVPLELTLSADLKGVESFRGCGHCSPWCACGDNEKHGVPFDGNLFKLATLTWHEAQEELKRTCRYPVSLKFATNAGHRSYMGDVLPAPCQFAKCPCYKKKPYQNEAEEAAAAAARKAAMRAAKTPKDKAALGAARSVKAKIHCNQREGQKPILPIGMNRVPVELLHLLYLNVPKHIFKWLVRRHLTSDQRHRLSEFFAAVHCPIDLKTKAEGRRTEDKWFSGAQWQKLVEGTPENPAGLVGVVSYIASLMLEDLPKLSSGEQRAARDDVQRRLRAGASISDAERDMWTMWGEAPTAKVSLMLHCFDAYLDLYCALCDQWVEDERVAAVREARALRVFVAAVKIFKYVEDSSTQHKSWYMHIMAYILPRHVARYGDLWRYSSGALEQRGAQLKTIGRSVACFRPYVAEAYTKTVGEREVHVRAHRHSAEGDIMYKCQARQALLQEDESVRYRSKEGNALLKVGRLTKHEKTKTNDKTNLETVSENRVYKV